MKKVIGWTAACFVLAIGVLACDDEDNGEGTLAIETWGEEYIEEGIPSSDFEDGYGTTFSKFLVNISDISVGSAIDAPQAMVWDLAQTGPFEITSAIVTADTYDHTAYAITPATANTVSGNVDGDDLQRMISGGFSIYAEGIGTDGTTTKSFAWAFTTDTLYDPCHSEGVLEDGGETSIQLTIHGDHLFYDSAVSSDPGLRFAEIASADTNDDGEVTQEELLALDLGPLEHHGVGSLPIDNMWDYISHMTTTLGHIDGEGHCDVQ